MCVWSLEAFEAYEDPWWEARREGEREREREEGRGERMVSCDLRFANVSFSVQARPDSPSGAYVDDYCNDTDIATYLQ